MSFAVATWLAALALIPIAIAGGGRRPPTREALCGPISRGVDAPTRRRRGRLVAASSPGCVPAGGDRGARPRARPTACQLQRPGRPGIGHARHRPLRLDGRHRRQADATGRRRGGRQHLHRSAPRERPRRRDRLLELARRRPGAGAQPHRRARGHQPAERERRDRDRRRAPAGAPAPARRRQEAPAVRDRAPLRRRRQRRRRRHDRRSPGGAGQDPDRHGRARHPGRRPPKSRPVPARRRPSLPIRS